MRTEHWGLRLVCCLRRKGRPRLHLLQIMAVELFVLVELVEPSCKLAQENLVGNVAEQLTGIFVNHQAKEVLHGAVFMLAEIGIDADAALAELEIGTERLEFENRTHGETLIMDEALGAFVKYIQNQGVVVPRLHQLKANEVIHIELVLVDDSIGNFVYIVNVDHETGGNLVHFVDIETLATVTTQIHFVAMLPVLSLQRATPVAGRRATLEPVVAAGSLLLLMHDEGSHQLVVGLGVSLALFSDALSHEIFERVVLAGYIFIIGEDGHLNLVAMDLL